jgi:hypothetical protein
VHRRTVSQAPASSPEDVEVALHTHVGVHRWATTARMLCFDATPGSPWLLVPPAVRCAFDALASAGIPLADTAFGPPMLGVKCGCNDAFVVSLDASGDTSSDGDDAVAAIHTSCAHAGRTPPSGRVERSLLRPVVRGQTLGRWMRCDTADGRGRQAGAQTAVEPARADAVRTTVLDGRVGATQCIARRRRGCREQEWIIWTHEDSGVERARPLPALPPHAAGWLGRWRHQLAARSDTRGQLPWWALFRTESASTMRPRVVWPDLGRTPRATLIPAGNPTVALNSCYVARADELADAHALTALLNSAVAAAWLNILAEPARGGYRRYMGWTVGLLPLPQPWEETRSVMAPLAAAALDGAPPSEARLTETVVAAYGLDLDVLHPLLSWSAA